jgi:hypothetical protein
MTELPLRKLITIGNNGADLASTNYWQTEHAQTGKFYLSGNAGTWRLLVPEAAEHMLSEMQTGSRVMTAGACRITVWTESGKQLDLPCFVNV